MGCVITVMVKMKNGTVEIDSIEKIKITNAGRDYLLIENKSGAYFLDRSSIRMQTFMPESASDKRLKEFFPMSGAAHGILA